VAASVKAQQNMNRHIFMEEPKRVIHKYRRFFRRLPLRT
jgi:hypothetical protein